MLEDSLRRIRHLYYAAPRSIKELVGRAYRAIPISIRLGGEYDRFVDLISASRAWSSEEIRAYQLGQLKHTVRMAYENIPYYKRTFDEAGVSPDTLRTLEDICHFPFITKQNIKQNFNELINPNVRKSDYLVTTTGGSTAEPMRFLQVKGITRSKEKAFIYAGWSRVGYRPGDKVVQLKGRSVARPASGVYWEYEPIQNFLEMDSNFLTADRLPHYLDAISKFDAKFCIGYASSVYLLARHLEQTGLKVPNFRAIMLASENVYPWQQVYLERIFGCRVFSHYGHSEMVLLGMEAPDSHDLLFFPQYGFLEVLSNDGKVAQEEEFGELVGTSFHNDLMPLIRYRTQDLGVVHEGNCEWSGYPILKKVEGRLQEFIVTQDRRLISVCVMGAAHFDTLDHVVATQYYQDTPGELEFRIIPGHGYSEIDRKNIEKAVAEKVGVDVRVRVREVDAIQKTRSGKHMMLIQKLPMDVLAGDQCMILSED